MFCCEVCNKSYLRKSNLTRHMIIHGDPKYKCTICSKPFFRKDNLRKHEVIHKSYKVFVTVKESYSINNVDENESEKVSLYPIPPLQTSDIESSDCDSVDFDQSSVELITVHLILPTENEKNDFFLFMNSSRDKVKHTLLHHLEAGVCYQWYLEISAQFSKCDINGVIAYFTPHLRSIEIKLEYDKLDTYIDQVFQVFSNSFVQIILNQFCNCGNEWVLDSMLYLESVFMKYHPLENLMTPSSNLLCEVCQNKFSSATALEEHRIIHNSNKFNCSFCNKFFDREENCKIHEYNHKHEPDMKENCDPSSTSENELIKKNGEIPLESISVTKYPHTNDSLYYNPFSSSQSSNQIIFKKQQCKTCQKVFSNSGNLNRHMKYHCTEKLKCSYSSSIYSCKDTLEIHENPHLFTIKENLDHSNPNNEIFFENISVPQYFHTENPPSCNPFLSSQVSDPNKVIPLENILVSKCLCTEDSLQIYNPFASNQSSSLTILNNNQCKICQKTFSRKSGLIRHMKQIHSNEKFKCSYCYSSFSRKDTLKRHENNHHLNKDHSDSDTEPKNNNASFEDAAPKDSEIENSSQPTNEDPKTNIHLILPKDDNNKNLSSFLETSRCELKDNISQKLAKYFEIKWCLKLTIEFSKNDPLGKTIFISASFCTSFIIIISEKLDQSINKAYQDILNSVEDFMIEESQKKGNELNLKSILCLESKTRAETIESKPETINSTYMQLPNEIILKRAVINIHNKDNKCFVWSVLAALHPPSSGINRVTKYLPYESELDLTGLSFPLSLSQIERFEEMNKISVNVFGYEKEVYPLFVTKNRFPKHVNLLLISDGKREHYCYIKNMSRLLASSTTHQAKRFYCNYCLRRFQLKRLYEKHECDGFMYNFKSKRKKTTHRKNNLLKNK